MNSGLEAVKAKRVWFIHNYSIWGVSQDAEIDFLAVESVDTVSTILFGNQEIGSSLQEVAFENLTDHRGNNLPQQIDSPKVIPRSLSGQNIFIVGQESDTHFKIARNSDTTESVLCDLMIIEMGA
ncbi:MAG: hypothetical protein DRP35_03175 [Candidatus Zixiibacteriota bacterium]|nr:MAG: hypothetical protein DRP35_03175 [candidate division Zixibacteria bacterium]